MYPEVPYDAPDKKEFFSERKLLLLTTVSARYTYQLVAEVHNKRAMYLVSALLNKREHFRSIIIAV